MASKKKNLRIIIEDSNTESPILHQNQNRNITLHQQQHQIPLYDSEVVEYERLEHRQSNRSKVYDDAKQYNIGLSTQYHSIQNKPIKVIGKSQIAFVESRLSQNIHSIQKQSSRGSRSRSLKPYIDFYDDVMEKQNKNMIIRSISNGQIGQSSSRKKIIGNILKKLKNTSQISDDGSRERPFYSQRNHRNQFWEIRNQFKAYPPQISKLESHRITTKLNKLENMLKEIKEINKTEGKIQKHHQGNQHIYIKQGIFRQQETSRYRQHNIEERSRGYRQKSFAKIHQQLKLVKNDLHEVKHKNEILKKQLSQKKNKNIKYYNVSPLNQFNTEIRDRGVFIVPKPDKSVRQGEGKGFSSFGGFMPKQSPIQALNNTVTQQYSGFRGRITQQDCIGRYNHSRK